MVDSGGGARARGGGPSALGVKRPKAPKNAAQGSAVRCERGLDGRGFHPGAWPWGAWPRSGSGGGAGRARMSSGRPAAPSPPPGGLPGPPPRRNRRGPAPRPPPGLPPAAGPGTNDVFVTSRSDFRAQLRRCQRLLAPGGGPGGVPGAGPGELRLHGLGLAVPRAINLALQLQAGAGGALRLHASTSSVPLRPPRGHRGAPPPRGDGDEDGDGEDGDPPRHNSAIHIRLCREAPCA